MGQGLMAWYRRWRHGRGFGVHSPFAYRFVMEVINEPLAYYAYDHLPKGMDRRDAALLFRVANYLQPAATWVAPGQHAEAIGQVMAMVPTALTDNPAEARLWVVDTPTDRLPQPPDGEHALVAMSLDAAGAQEAWQRATAGAVTFGCAKRRPWIAVWRHGVPEQHFMLNYR